MYRKTRGGSKLMLLYRIDNLYTGNNVKILDVLDDEIKDKENIVLEESLKLSLEEIKNKYKNYYWWWVNKTVKDLYEEYVYHENITIYSVEDFIVLADLDEKGILIITKKPKYIYEVNNKVVDI